MKLQKLLMLMLMASVMSAISIETATSDEVNLTLEGHFGGLTFAVEVSGNFAFIGQGQDFIVLDISNPTTPLELGRLNISGYYIRDIKISNNYAYVADRDNGLVIIDISDPSVPYLAGHYDTAGLAYDIAVSGSYAYVADYNNGLVIVDISDPSTPYLAGHYNTLEYAHGIAVSGSYAYVADCDNGLVIIDISDPSVPYLAGHYDTAGLAYDIAVSGSYAYVADWYNGFVIVDISDPSTPYLAGNYDTAGSAKSIAVSGSYAYIAEYNNGLAIVDISDPSTPYLVGNYDTAGIAYGIAVSGSYAYVADYYNGLAIVDISDPSTPYLVGNYDTAGFARGIAVSDSYAYIVDDHNGLAIVDISDPSIPYLAGHYDTAGIAYGIAVSGSYAYVADCNNGLAIVDISDPSTPYLAGHYDTAGFARGIAVSGSYAYIVDDHNGLAIVDISDPSTPYLVGNYDTVGHAYGIAVSGSYAYVADCDNGLVIIDISDPSVPYLAGHYDTAGITYGIAVSDSYAYVADWYNGLVIVDISDLSTLYLAGNYDTVGRAHGIAVSGSYAYVADCNNGLVILRTDTSHTGPQDRTLLQVEGHSEVYWLQNNKLYWVTDWDVINNMAGVPGWDSVNTLPESEFDPAAYTQGPRFITTGAESDELLIREQGDIELYLIQSGEKHHFISKEVFLSMGYSFNDVIDVSSQIIQMFPTGSDIGTGPIAVGQGAPDLAIKNHFIDAYNRNGGANVLGSPTTEVHEAWGYLVQDFPGVSGIPGGVIMYNDIRGAAYYIHGAIWERYYTFVDKSELGPVASDEGEAAILPQGTTGRYTKFETGTIHWISDKDDENVGHSQRGESFVTYGELDALYTSIGGTYSDLGFPIMDQEKREGYGYCEFEEGYIEWDESGYKTVIDLGEKNERHKYYVRISNIDDIGEVRVNGHLIARTEYYGDSGWIDIHEPRGDNFIDLKVINNGGDWTYKFELKQDDTIIWSDSCGEVGEPGKSCNENTDTGVVYHKVLRFKNKAPVNVNVIFATFNDFDDINPLLPQSPKLEINKYAIQFNNIHNYYEQNSYGAINFNFNVANSHKNNDEYEWYRLGNNFDYYISNPLSLPLNNDLHLYSNRNGVKLNFAKDAIEIADNAINYNDFDVNLLIYPPAVYSYFDPKLTTEIFPLGNGKAEAWPINYSTTDSENSRNWIVLSVKTSGLNKYWTGDGEETWAHELGHHMGSLHHLITPDLYNGGSSVGNWDIMHHNYGYMSSFSKEWVGWLNYQDESEFKEYEIFPLNNLKLGDDVIKYTPTTTSYISKPYYIFEYRKAEGFDAILNNDENKLNSNNPNGAILIYKVKNCGTYHGTKNRLNGEDEIDKCIVNVINQDHKSVEEPTLYNEVKLINDLIYLDSNIIDPTKDDYEIKYINFALSKDPDGNSAKINVKEETVVKSKGVYLKMLNDFIKNLDITFSSPSDDNLQPTLTLHAYSDDGKHVGINYETGEYEVQIPGAMTSGLQPNGHEWILVPEDINIKYRVDSYANDEYLRQNPDINTDGFDLYEFVGLYFDENGNSHLEVITQSIPPGVQNEHSVMITQNSVGSYSLDITKQYNITFLPPITTMDQFNLTDGSTLPIKFIARDSTTDDFIQDDTVNVTITNFKGHLITYFTNGTGTDSVRINTEEEQYVVNFHTKDYALNVGETYVVTATFGEMDSLRGYEITYFTLIEGGKAKGRPSTT